jgi:hypothetical protein
MCKLLEMAEPPNVTTYVGGLLSSIPNWPAIGNDRTIYACGQSLWLSETLLWSLIIGWLGYSESSQKEGSAATAVMVVED